MIGKYRIRPKGLGIIETLQTARDVEQTLKEVLPTVKVIASDYEKLSPSINFMAKYWPTVLVAVALVAGMGSAIGAYVVLRKLEK